MMLQSLLHAMQGYGAIGMSCNAVDRTWMLLLHLQLELQLVCTITQSSNEDV